MKKILLPLLLLFAAAAAAQAVPAPDPLQANKALVKRYIEEILSANRMEKLEEMLGTDVLVFHGYADHLRDYDVYVLVTATRAAAHHRPTCATGSPTASRRASRPCCRRRTG